MYGLTALAFLLATSSCIQATSIPSSVAKSTVASISSVMPSHSNTDLTIAIAANATPSSSKPAVSNASQTSSPFNFSSAVGQASTYTSSAKNPWMSSSVVSVLVTPMATSLGSNPTSIVPASSYGSNVTNVTATSSGVQDSNSTNSVVGVVVSSAVPAETSTINQTATKTSISVVPPVSGATKSTTAPISMAPTTSESSSNHSSRFQILSSLIVTASDSVASTAQADAVSSTTLAQATASTMTMASYTSQFPSKDRGSSHSAVPSQPPSSDSASPKVRASSAGNVTGSASPQAATTVATHSSVMLQASMQDSVILTFSELKATSTVILGASPSLLSPTLGIRSSSEIASIPSSLADTQVARPPSPSEHSETTTVKTSSLVGSLTASVSNSSSSASFPINSSSSVTTAASNSSPRPTFPQEGTKIVSIEASLDIEFIVEYNDPNSPQYKELATNLTKNLIKVYERVKGFVGIRILFFKKGSVICSYVVILAKNAQVKDEELTKFLEKANKDGTFVFKVKSVKVEERPTEGSTKEPDEKLTEWALITMIALGSLAFIFLVTVICVWVKYRRTISGESNAYYIPTGELGMHTYETVSMGDVTARASSDGKTSTAQRRLVASHSNPSYGSNIAMTD